MTTKKRFLIIGILVLMVAGLIAGGWYRLGHSSAQSVALYEDPQGRFSMEIEPTWEQVETDGSYAHFKLPEMPAQMYLLVLKASSVDEAFSKAMETVGFDPVLLNGDSTTTYGDWQAYQQDDPAGLTYGLAGQVLGDNAYVMIIKTDKPGVSVENPSVFRVLTSIKVANQGDVLIKSFADVEALVRKEVDRLPGSSLSIAVVDKDKIVYTYVYGQANPAAGIQADTQTIYQYGSMTKVVTATALMQLAEQGKIDLDAWVGKYVPEFPQSWNITVRQLLDHTDCMPYSDRLTDGLIAYLGETFSTMKEIFTKYTQDYPDLVCEPGKAAAYANPPFLVLGRVIEEVSGEPYDTYVINHLLTPLDMKSTSFKFVEANVRYAKDQYPTAKVDDLVSELIDYHGPSKEPFVLQKGKDFATLNDYQILPPWGGLRGTPSDLAHFVQMHLNGGRYGDKQILKKDTVASMQENQLSTEGSLLGFGLAWWVGKDNFGDYVYHTGNGAGSEGNMRIYPDLGIGVVVMSNVTGYQRDKIVSGLVNAWMNEK